MGFHRLLKRQLAKLSLSEASLPAELGAWQAFLNRVSKTYDEQDQDRYLLERSIDISSTEMREANTMLEYAQEIAQMGYWHYETDNKISTWSKGLFLILGLSPNQSALSFEQFMRLVHPEDEADFRKQVEMTLTQGMAYEFDLRVQKYNEGYRWFRIIARAELDKKQLAGIMMDINDIKLGEELRKQLHNKLIIAARMAGMSEVATTILHNIGNILNSVNISASILKKKTSQEHHKKLSIIVGLLEEHLSDLQRYLTKDERGKLILPYLHALANALAVDFSSNAAETENLETNIGFIKEIISTQQSLAGKTTVMETVILPDLIHHAVKSLSLSEHEIQVDVECDTKLKRIQSDKSKLFQILTNLLTNAKDALCSKDSSGEKKIKISVERCDSNRLCIRIEDKGVGIPNQDLERIFSFGFTTKQDGHGFGLHSSAIYARELGGSLLAESAGKNAGACFVLTLPLKGQEGEG